MTFDDHPTADQAAQVQQAAGSVDAVVALCTYSDQSLMAAPLATIITGGQKPEGKLPVAIPTSEGSIPVGTGLSW